MKKAKRSKIDVLETKKVVDAKTKQLLAVQIPTKSAFKAWLKKMGNRVVGKCASARTCALATYLVKDTPNLYVVVQNYGITLSTKSKWVRESVKLAGDKENVEWRSLACPEWANNFIQIFDDIKGKRKPVTGREALAAWTGKT